MITVEEAERQAREIAKLFREYLQEAARLLWELYQEQTEITE